MTARKAAKREPKPPRGDIVVLPPARYIVIKYSDGDEPCMHLTREEMDTLCRWWLKWREWEKGARK